MNERISAWHQLVKKRDTRELENLLADDVVFYSPVVHTPQTGKKITTLYLSAALQVFINDTFHYVREIDSGDDAALEFEVEIDGVMVNGVDMIRWNKAGKIAEFRVFVRPLKAINLIHEKMAALLKAKQ